MRSKRCVCHIVCQLSTLGTEGKSACAETRRAAGEYAYASSSRFSLSFV